MIRVPGHISAVFYPVREESPDYTGSLGAGFSVSVGCLTEVVPGNGRIYVNGIPGEFTSGYVLSKLSTKHDLFHATEAPIGYGFGMSGACSLGAALELGRVLNLDKSPEELAHIAHLADVVNNTGLGDVIGSFYGGFEVRIEPGSPLTGKILRGEPDGRHVAIVAIGPLETPKILGSKEVLDKVLKAAESVLDELRPDPKSIVEAGREFAEKSGLIDMAGIRKLYEALSREYDLVSMVMLSKGVFVLSKDKEELIDIKMRYGEHAWLGTIADGWTFI